MGSALEVHNLKKSYGVIAALKGISFSVNPGEIFALIGPNGAGKSTALRIIATILSASSGTAAVFGHDVSTAPQKVRELISYLPEEAGAYKNLTGIQYLQFMASLSAPDASSRQQFLAAARPIADLGARLSDKIGSYSKGMTRKLLLARTVMSNPKLAILDEPTSGLDVLNAMQIRRTIKDLVKKGMTVLLSSHNMLEIEFLSDRVAMIDKGRIIVTGTAGELKKKYRAGNLEEVFARVAA